MHSDSLVTRAEVCSALVTFSFQVKTSKSEYIVAAEYWYQNIKLRTLGQHVTVGECCFEADSVDVTVGSW
jgi:hypothetical protein